MPKRNKKKKGQCSFELVIKETKNNEEKEDNEEFLPKTKNEMITYKKLQNIDSTIYDVIFSDRQIGNSILEDFASFKILLQDIKNQFKPELLYNKNISIIKKEGKFSFDKYNLAKMVPFREKRFKNLDISINNRYINIKDNEVKLRQFYINKSIFKGKHCFEINIVNSFDAKMIFGLVDINSIDHLSKELFELNCNDFNRNNIILTKNIDCFILESPIFIRKDTDNIYHHFLKNGDII